MVPVVSGTSENSTLTGMTTPPPIPSIDLLTVNEAAITLRVTPQTIYLYLGRHWLIGRKIGRHWLIQRASVLRLLESGTSYLRLDRFRPRPEPRR
jgi:excisionase family DNA binding protein